MNTAIEEMPVHSTSRKMLGRDSVPMNILNEEWAQVNHGQTLKRLAERGGLGILEMLDNIHKRRLSHRNETSEDAALLIKIIQIQERKVEADAAPESDAVEFADFLVDLKVSPVGGGIWEIHGKGVVHEDGKTGACPVMKTKDIYDKLFKNR